MRVALRSEWPWVSVIAASICLLLALLPESQIEHLSGDRQAILQGDLWRLWTAHLTHFSLRHAVIDSMTLCLIGALAESVFGSRRLALWLFVGAPVISMAMLLAAPALLDYRGASAMAVLLATAVGLSLWRSLPSSRLSLSILVLCLFAKIGFDAAGLSVTLADLPDHVRVAWQAHLLGIVVGGLAYFSGACAQRATASASGDAHLFLSAE